MSTVSSTSILASWDPKELFELVNPDKLSITCVGYAPSCRRRCMNTIAHRNVQAAKALMSQIVRPAASKDELKGMLFDLAGYTLCRGYHQGQARTVSDRWLGMVQRQLDDEDDRGSDTSEDDDDDSDSDSDSSTGSGSTTDSDSDEDDDDSNRTNTFDNNAGELRRRFEELETLQREFGELLQRQRQNLQNRASSPSTTTQTQQAQASSKSSRDAAGSSTTYQHQKSPEALRSAEQKRQEEAHQTAEHNRAVAREQLRSERTEQIERDEALRQAQRERPEQEATAQAELLLQQQRAEQARLERAAKAEAERLLKAQKAEKARLELERRAKEQEQARSLSWESAWDRYEAAWSELICSNGETDISTSAIWPTKSGLLHSCCEEDVKAFFCCRPESMNRRMVRRQALRWHPDRAARLFATVVDQQMVGEILKNVTMISQVVNEIMGATAL